MRLLLLVVFAWFGTVQLAFAASATVRYSAEVPETCTVSLSSSEINFPNYEGEEIDIPGPEIRVNCVRTASYRVELSDGLLAPGGIFQGRLMTHTQNPNATLRYNLFTGSGRFIDQAWSSGGFTGDQSTGPDPFRAFARLYGGQTGRPAGRYEAELVVSLILN